MKPVLDFLRKMGMLHVHSGDYQTGEFDNRKDIKKKSKSKKTPKAAAGGAFLAGAMAVSSKWMILFWILVVFVVFFLLVFWISYGLSFWLILFFAFWFFFFKKLKIQILAGKLLFWKMFFIFLGLSFFSLIFLVPSEDADSSSKSSKKSMSKLEESGLIEVNQAQFSSFIFGSSSKGNSKTDTVHLTINPILTFKVDGNQEVKLESFEIKNLEFSDEPKVGEIKMIAPKHRKTDESCTGFYFGGCKDKAQPEDVKSDGESIEYEVVEGDVEKTKTKYYDQVFDTWFVRPEFRVILHNIGEFDYDEVMEKNKAVDGGKYAQYAGLEADDLASVLEFDVVAKMSNGEKFKKHFVAEFDGEDLMKMKTVQMDY